MGELDAQSDVVFLLGAGASKAAEVPDTYEFVDEFRKSIAHIPVDAAALDDVLARLNAWCAADESRPKQVDIEMLLETLTRIAERGSDASLAFCRNAAPHDDGVAGAAGRLITALRDCIKKRTLVNPEQTEHLDPLMSFIRHHGCIDIATLNYDTVVEEFGYRQRVPVHDGFRQDWDPASLRDATAGIRLYKLHGSVTWYETADGRHVKERVHVPASKVQLVQAGAAENLMLYPVRKWAYSEPMVGLLFEFKRILEDAKTRFLVVVGYSFRDDHVQKVVRDVARKNERLEIVLIDPNAHGIRAKLFDAPGGPRWPAHIRRRVLCLPYRFEVVLPHLKVSYLDALRTAANAEDEAELAEAKGGAASDKWQTAAAHLAECEHATRFDEARRRGLVGAVAVLGDLRPRLLQVVNAAAGGTNDTAWDGAANVAEALRTFVAQAVHCECVLSGSDGPRVRLRVGALHSCWTEGCGGGRVFDALRSRVERSVDAAAHPNGTLRRIQSTLRRVCEALRAAAEDETGTSPQVARWIESTWCSPDHRLQLRGLLYAAAQSTTDDSPRNVLNALNQELTAAVRDAALASIDEALAAPR